MSIGGLPRLLARHGQRILAPAGGYPRHELADLTLIARWLLQRGASAAQQSGGAAAALRAHLGPDAAALPVVSCTWPAHEHVNIQLAVDAWLAGPGRRHDLAGITGTSVRPPFGLADLLAAGTSGQLPAAGAGLCGARTVALPAGPGGITRPGAEWGLYLATDGGQPLAMLLRPGEHAAQPEIVLELAARSQPRIEAALAQIRRAAMQRSVFRGQVIALGPELPGSGHGQPVRFLDRPAVTRDEVILPDSLLAGIESQVLGIAGHARRLAVAGQHLKRGLLLHGAPGTGKTHTIRYLLGRLTGVTVVVVAGQAAGLVSQACALARTLQPSVVVVEDVDLIAGERGTGPAGSRSLLQALLGEMDGLGPDADVTFLLTTNRADLLEPALAERPGRVDHAALLPLPDAPARRRLLRLYRGSLELDLSDPEAVISRTEGLPASFIKELLRRAALRAAAGASPAGASPADGQAADVQAADVRPLRVTDAHLSAALDQLLDSRGQLSRVLLGGRSGSDHLVAGADAVIRNPAGLVRRVSGR